MVTRLLPVALSLLASVGGGGANALVLVEKGEPRARIVLGSTPTELERLAAGDLQEYLQRMSGAKLPIVSSGRIALGTPWF